MVTFPILQEARNSSVSAYELSRDDLDIDQELRISLADFLIGGGVATD